MKEVSHFWIWRYIRVSLPRRRRSSAQCSSLADILPPFFFSDSFARGYALSLSLSLPPARIAPVNEQAEVQKRDCLMRVWTRHSAPNSRLSKHHFFFFVYFFCFFSEWAKKSTLAVSQKTIFIIYALWKRPVAEVLSPLPFSLFKITFSMFSLDIVTLRRCEIPTFFAPMVTDCSDQIFSVVHWYWRVNWIFTIRRIAKWIL